MNSDCRRAATAISVLVVSIVTVGLSVAVSLVRSFRAPYGFRISLVWVDVSKNRKRMSMRKMASINRGYPDLFRLQGYHHDE